MKQIDLLEIDEKFVENFERNDKICSLCNLGKVAKASIEQSIKFNDFYCYFYCENHENTHNEFLTIKVFPIEDKDNFFDFAKKLVVLM